MTRIGLNPRERILVEDVVGEQNGKAGDLRMAFAILEKVVTTQEYRGKFVRAFPGGVLWNEDAIAAEPNFALEMETMEAERLQTILETWPGFQAKTMRWVYPILEKLRAALASK